MRTRSLLSPLLSAVLLVSVVPAWAQEPPPPAPAPPSPAPPPPPPPPPAEDAAPAQAGGDPKVHDRHEAQQSSSQPGASAPARQQVLPSSEPPKQSTEDDPEKKFTVGGYVETYYQYNFDHPGNGITNYRFDDRANTFALQNAVVDVGFRAHQLLGRVALQTGRTPASMFGQETSLPGTDAVGETSPQLWRHLQRASAGWQLSKSFLLEGGLFLSNVTLESIPVKDNWNWSRTHLVTRMPNYFTGVKGTVTVSDELDVSAMVVNGWNKVVDDNDEKSGILQVLYHHGDTYTASFSYIGGVEREGGAPEGRAYRHLADAWMQWKINSVVSVGADTLLGAEHGHFGLHWYAAAAGYGRFHLFDPLWLALRVDRLWEDPAANASGVARPIFIAAKDVTSLASTLDYRPVNGLSLRIEGRHDFAQSNLFFRSNVQGDGTATSPYVPNAKAQTTALLGLVAWF